MPSSVKLVLAAALVIAAAVFSLGVAQEPRLYQNPSAPIEKRVDDLISRMTIEEKVGQMMNDAPAIERLGVPAYNWWNECLHGVARAGRATVFPEAIGLAATWDANLLYRVATVISDEARAKHHEFLRRDKHNIYQGLTFWTPNINLFRDPRWGRGMETYGEDPYLTGQMAFQFIRGIQGDDPKYLKAIATAKHFAVHSGPESLRHTFDAAIDDRDLFDTYLPHFEAAIKDAGAASVMCAYNRVDGQAACASPMLLEDVLRKQWGFNGYVVSDCGAIGDIYLNHKVEPNAEAGVAKAVKMGTDLNCGVEYVHLLPAVKAGLIKESELDVSLRRLFMARFKLGMFDPPSMVKYARIPYSENDSPAHRHLAVETARKAIVLLKNENQALPLAKSGTVAVIGPDAADPEVLQGNYNGTPSAPVTPLEGIRRKLDGKAKVTYARGTDLAVNMPYFEVIPTSALSTTNDSSRKPGLTGEYYTSANFDGKAHRPRELTYPNSGKMVGDIPANPKPLFTRIDPTVDFRWWDGAPRPGMNDDDFGVRWTGYLQAPVTGKYYLGAHGMNAFEFYLDGKRLFDFNNIHEPSYSSAAVSLEAGKLYQIRLDFHEFVNDAQIRLVWAKPSVDSTREAVEAARQATAVVMVLGLHPRLEGEEMPVPVEGFQGGDRVQIGLPRIQEELLEKIAAVGKPTVLVLMNGSALSVKWAHDHIPAIVEAWYPGQGGGDAIADVLFGDYNPAGRLPVTFYQSVDQLPPFTDYSMKGRTYRYFDGQALYPFGFGLSYTTFAYRKLALPAQLQAGDRAQVSVEVENTGSRSGEEVVQLYLGTPGGAAPRPIRTLAGFERVALRAGEKKTVTFTLAPRQLAATQPGGRRAVAPGTVEIGIGGSQNAAVAGRIQVAGPVKEIN